MMLKITLPLLLLTSSTAALCQTLVNGLPPGIVTSVSTVAPDSTGKGIVGANGSCPTAVQKTR